MIWYTITDQETDQTPLGKGSNLLVGTAAQVTDNLKRLKEAGLEPAADLAALRGRAGFEDARRPQAAEAGDHAERRGHVTPQRHSGVLACGGTRAADIGQWAGPATKTASSLPFRATARPRALPSSRSRHS